MPLSLDLNRDLLISSTREDLKDSPKYVHYLKERRTPGFQLTQELATEIVTEVGVATYISLTGAGSQCARCGSKNAGLSTCSACKLTKFCGEECQKKVWKQHKPICKAHVEAMSSENEFDNMPPQLPTYRRPRSLFSGILAKRKLA